MKKVILSMAVIAALAFTSCKNEAKKEIKITTTEESVAKVKTNLTFGVRALTPKVRFVFTLATDSSVVVIFISFLASFLQLVNANAAITAILKITFFILLKFNYCYSITCFTSPLVSILFPK